MNWRSLPSPLLCGAILLSLATVASAVPLPPKPTQPSNKAALLQRAAAAARQLQLQRAAAAARQLQLQRAAAAARQHQILAVHARTSQQQLLLKAQENSAKQLLLPQARRPEPLDAIGVGDPYDQSRSAPVTTIQSE